MVVLRTTRQGDETRMPLRPSHQHPYGPDRPVRRREVLRDLGLASATAVVAGTYLAGCGPQKAPPPTANAPKITLTLAPWAYAGEPLAEGAALLLQACQPFLDKNPGIALKMDVGIVGNPGALVPAIIAGSAPDVLQDWNFFSYISQGLLVPLEQYSRRDNMSLQAFNQGQLEEYYDLQGNLIALPAQSDPVANAVNLSILDELGLPYPSETWTWTEAELLWRAVAGTTLHGRRQYGSNLTNCCQAVPFGRFYLLGFGGDFADPANHGRCVVGNAGSVAAVNWMATLIHDKVCALGGDPYGDYFAQFPKGGLLTTVVGSWDMLQHAVHWGNTFKWRYYAMPKWPVRAATACTSNFWAIPSTCKNVDAAWELLKYVAWSPDWQRSMMKLFLTVPSVQTLWSEWETFVGQVAPPLKDKNIGAFSQLAQRNEMFADQVFSYATPASYGIIGKWWQMVVDRKVDAQGGMTQAQDQVNALQRAGGEREGAAAATAKAFPTQGPTIAAVTPGL